MPSARTWSRLRLLGASVLFDYEFSTFHGYSVRAPSTMLESELTFLTAAEVKYYEPNQMVHANKAVEFHMEKPKTMINVTAECNVQEEATWGIVRVSKPELNLNGLYPWNPEADGRGVNVYVIDTGIYLDHVEFQRRATWGFDAVDNPSPRNDPNGHGTHCAGTVMSGAYGVAKAANAIAVRVLGASGSGSIAGVVAGIQFTARDGAGKKSVASMSLGGGKSQALNDAVKAGVDAGVPFVVAAGNEARDACTRSPASEPSAITVMCSDSSDAFCYFSNFGSCAHIIAPGMGITSTWIGSPYATNTISGTSMSTPHVAGVAAKLLSSAAGGSLTPAQLKAQLVEKSTRGKITGIPASIPTANALLQTPCPDA